MTAFKKKYLTFIRTPPQTGANYANDPNSSSHHRVREWCLLVPWLQAATQSVQTLIVTFSPLLQMLACKQAKPSEHIQTVLHYTRPCVNTCARALYKATSQANIYSVAQICVYMDIVGVPAICRGRQHTVAVRVESNFTKDKWLYIFFSVFFFKRGIQRG